MIEATVPSSARRRPGEAERTLRLLFQVPKDVTVKSLSLAEKIDNSGGMSRGLLYDLASIK